MRSAGFVGVLLALGAAYFIYSQQLTRPGSAPTSSPQAQIDLTSVRASLMEIGQAQRVYVVNHGAYGTLEELRADGPASLGADGRGYVFRVEPNGSQSFTATATPVDASRAGWPTLTITDTMQISSQP